jgi:hypothetical protein
MQRAVLPYVVLFDGIKSRDTRSCSVTELVYLVNTVCLTSMNLRKTALGRRLIMVDLHI